MKKRKIIALLLAVTMAAGALAGCGGGDSTASTDGTASGSEGGSSEDGSAESGEVIELTFFSADANQDDPWTDPVALAIT